jgi:malonate-semialdehyde dehydrogenase (acetylating)/methylmalonate-semialdehyde dehydrogenase
MGGAKNHMVVMPDADMNMVGDAIMGSVFGSAGERCMAISVVVPVGEETADKIKEIVAPKIQNLKIGSGLDPDSEMGPLVTSEHLSKVKGYIEKGISEGADLIVDGRDLKLQGFENGFFIGCSFFDNVTT